MTTAIAPDQPSLDTFGGPYKNADGVVDPETDLAAEAFNRLLAQVVMLSRTAAKAHVRVLISGGVGTIEWHSAVWGDSSGVIPELTRTGTGVYLLEWSSTYPDLQAVPEVHAVAFRGAQVSAEVSGAGRRIPSYELADHQVVVRFSNDAGTAADPDGFTVSLF
jgi:hypothetical protein